MIILDSSCWIEIFSKGPLHAKFIQFLKDPDDLIVPTIILTEVFKKLLGDRSEKDALYVVGQIEQCKIIELTQDLALEAAKYGNRLKLPLADSIIYATAMKHNGILYTMDKHFKDLPNVQFFDE